MFEIKLIASYDLADHASDAQGARGSHKVGDADKIGVPEGKDLDYLKDLGQLAAPVLFVAGSEDKGAPPDTMRDMAAAAKTGEFSLIADAGHIINVNQPEAFSLAIRGFLGMSETP